MAVRIGARHNASRSLNRSAPECGRSQRNLVISPAKKSREGSPNFFGEDANEQQPITLDNVNPVLLGRQARMKFDQFWTQLSQLAAPTKSILYDDDVESSMADEDPQARSTTVLVTGATGRVGRIVVRKLLLRGYKVKALVRNREKAESILPASVQLVVGDVGEQKDCQKASSGVNKVIHCAAARTVFTADLLRVEERGVMNLVKAMQDENYRNARKVRGFSAMSKREVADFSITYHQLRWDITYCGAPGREAASEYSAMTNMAVAEIDPVEKNLIFEGVLIQKGALAEVSAPLNPKMSGGDFRIAGCEGLSLRVKGDTRSYYIVLTTLEGHRFFARFFTKEGYQHIRLPFAVFRPETPNQPQELDPALVVDMAFRYQHRPNTPGLSKVLAQQDLVGRQRFKLEIDWIKALPGGVEPDFILVSCAGKRRMDMPEVEMEKVITYKRQGEENLRLSGMGYTIVRPGPLVDEPGGYKALVFDQGERINQSISASDVADICLRALHEPNARNKTFEVSYEYTPEAGLQMYELLARMPDKSNNYLAPALATLQKNT